MTEQTHAYVAYTGSHGERFEAACIRIAKWIVENPSGVMQTTFLDAETARRSMKRVTEILNYWDELAKSFPANVEE